MNVQVIPEGAGHRPWSYEPADLNASGQRLDRLHTVALRSTSSSASAEEAIVSALLDDLDVPRALDVAEEAGGEGGTAAAAHAGPWTDLGQGRSASQG